MVYHNQNYWVFGFYSIFRYSRTMEKVQKPSNSEECICSVLFVEGDWKYVYKSGRIVK
jgi:hypothetical protein